MRAGSPTCSPWRECELVVTPDQLDTYPFLLNFLNGTLDLRTGDLAAARPDHFITKLVHYNYDPDAGARCS